VIFDSHEAGGWKAVYVSATAGEVTGADVERGIELFNRNSCRRCGIYVLRFSNIISSGSLKRELTAKSGWHRMTACRVKYWPKNRWLSLM
jgi:uncharacterized protein with PIN domain